MELVIFDFDGTLIDSEPGIRKSIALTVAELNLPGSAVEAWRQMIGLPLGVQLARLLPPERQTEIERGIEIYRRYYAEIGPQHSDPFAGIPAVLEFLRPRLPMAIASSKQRPSIERVLQRWQWQDWFDPIVVPADVAQPKPHPESIDRILSQHACPRPAAVMIGDTEFDMEMARAAGIEGWGVSWGIHEPERLLRAGASRCFAQPQELLAQLQAV